MRYQLSPEWSIDVPEGYQWRKEGDHMIFWRKGATILITVFAYSGEKNRQVLLANLKARAEADKLEVIADLDGDIERFGYFKTEDMKKEAAVGAVTEDFTKLVDLKMISGRFLNKNDLEGGADIVPDTPADQVITD